MFTTITNRYGCHHKVESAITLYSVHVSLQQHLLVYQFICRLALGSSGLTAVALPATEFSYRSLFRVS